MYKMLICPIGAKPSVVFGPIDAHYRPRRNETVVFEATFEAAIKQSLGWRDTVNVKFVVQKIQNRFDTGPNCFTIFIKGEKW